MNKIYAAVGIAVLFGLYTWWVFNLGVNSCEAKVDKTTTTETIRQGGDVAQLTGAEVLHGEQVKGTIQYIRLKPAPQDCDKVDVGDDRVNALGGVRDKVRHGAY